MAGQLPASRPNDFQNPRLPFERMSPLGAPASQLGHFSMAVAPGYQPRPQMSAPAYAPAPAATSNIFPSPAPIVAPEDQEAVNYLRKLDERRSISPLAPQPIDLDKFKGFKFVTLDSYIVATRDIYDKISGTYKWEMCETQIDRCLKFVQEDCANKRVFLITAGGLGKEVIPKIHNLPQIYAIYVYCGTLRYHVPWVQEYSKVRVVCDDDDRYLLPQLAVDVAQSNIDWGNALLQKGDKAKAKDKFEKARNNLKEHAKKPNPGMLPEVESKLTQCT